MTQKPAAPYIHVMCQFFGVPGAFFVTLSPLYYSLRFLRKWHHGNTCTQMRTSIHKIQRRSAMTKIFTRGYISEHEHKNIFHVQGGITNKTRDDAFKPAPRLRTGNTVPRPFFLNAKHKAVLQYPSAKRTTAHGPRCYFHTAPTSPARRRRQQHFDQLVDRAPHTRGGSCPPNG